MARLDNLNMWLNFDFKKDSEVSAKNVVMKLLVVYESVIEGLIDGRHWDLVDELLRHIQKSTDVGQELKTTKKKENCHGSSCR